MKLAHWCRMGFPGPRERLLEKGAHSLHDTELIAILLRTGVHGCNVLTLSEHILSHCGSLRELFSANVEELQGIPGLGKAKIATLLAIKEIAHRVWRGSDMSVEISNGERAYELFCDIVHEPQEVLVAAFLNTQNRLLARREIFRGSLDVSVANPREIIREAFKTNAAKIIVAHNHPSQNPEPSEQDRRFTMKMELAARTVGIPLVDHLVVCEAKRYFSFARAKLLKQHEGRS